MTEQLKDGFVDRITRGPTGSGALDGLTFGLKDLYDVKGRVTGCGNPDWRKTHSAALQDCPVLTSLLAAGAALTGITHTDELAYSLNGENHHYGTPPNPMAPGRIPGGSSSGSASVTAAGLVHFAIGSDTGGSVRIPAAYCGLYGMRVSHGAVALDGVMPLAPSYDTGGWFAQDVETLRRVGEILLPAVQQVARTPRWLADPMLFALCDPSTGAALRNVVKGLNLGDRHADLGMDPEGWRDAFRVLQAREIWQVHGDWITENAPEFGSGVKERFQMASKITDEEVQQMQPVRNVVTARLDDLLADDGILLLPSAPGPAPVLNWDPALLDRFRYRVIALTCIAGHAGLPQISLPADMVAGGPVGLSLIGPRGSDRWLLEQAEALAGDA